MTETTLATADSRPRARGGVVRILVRDAVVLAAIAVAAEFALRVADPRYARHLFDADFTGGFPVAVNEQGLRGPVVPIDKAPGEVRVLALGDSTTFGTGVAAEAAWPARLERMLAAYGRHATVMNAASPGADVRQLTYGLGHEWTAYRPDVVALATTGNLVSLAWIRKNDVAAAPERATAAKPSPFERVKIDANRAVKRLCLPSFLSLNVERGLYRVGLLEHNIRPAEPYGAMLAHGWRQIGLDPVLASEAWRVFESDVDALRRAARRAGARFVVTALPSRFMLTDSWSDNEKAVPRQRLTMNPPDRVREVCGRLGAEYVDSVEALRAKRRDADCVDDPLYIQCDYTHLDALGHEAVARAVLSAIERRLK